MALNVLVWSDRHPISLRRTAMDRLIVHDAEAFWRNADRWLERVDEPAMLRAIGERALRDDRRDVIPAVLRRWAKPSRRVADADRVERKIFSKFVAPAKVNQALWEYVADSANPVWSKNTPPVSWSAWALLSRLEDDATLRAGLQNAPTESTLVRDLRAAAQVVDVLPTSAEGLRWLTALRDDRAVWSAYEGLRESIGLSWRSGLGLRHLAMLSRLSAEDRDKRDDQLLAEVAADHAAAVRIPRDQPAGIAVGFDAAGGDWTRTDLALVQILQRALREPAVVAAWFAQADTDVADTTTEYGGVLTWAGDGWFVAQPFEPRRREGDRKFFSSPELVDAMTTGLAQYHFHAQGYDNAAYAGPGRGDLAFARAMETQALTITFVERDRLNIDLAFPDGRVLDLGCIDRPVAGR